MGNRTALERWHNASGEFFGDDNTGEGDLYYSWATPYIGNLGFLSILLVGHTEREAKYFCLYRSMIFDRCFSVKLSK